MSLHSNNNCLADCKYEYKNQTYDLPNTPTFIVAGAQKTGSTSLLSYLARHPQIQTTTKSFEGHFFDNMFHTTASMSLCSLRKSYLEYWKPGLIFNNQRPYTFDKTPQYILTPHAPELLKRMCPWIPKIIITLRNPADRAWSDYKMERRRIKENPPNFEEHIRIEIEHLRQHGLTTAPILPSNKLLTTDDTTNIHSSSYNTMMIVPWNHTTIIDSDWEWKLEYNRRWNRTQFMFVHKGIYAPQLRMWFNHYPRDAIMVIDYRDLVKNTSDVYYRILDFVGIPRDDKKASAFTRLNQDGRQEEIMSNATRAYLESFYAPYNAQLEDILGPEWKGAWTKDWR